MESRIEVSAIIHEKLKGFRYKLYHTTEEVDEIYFIPHCVNGVWGIYRILASYEFDSRYYVEVGILVVCANENHALEFYESILSDTSTESKRDSIKIIKSIEKELIDSEFERLINKALDERDHEAFKHWTGEFERMREEVK